MANPLKHWAHLTLRAAEVPLKPLVARSPRLHRLLAQAYWEGLHHLAYAPLHPKNAIKPPSETLTQHLRQALGPPGQRILELGCGVGGVLCRLLEAGYDAYGLDISPRRVLECRRRCGRERCWVGDMLTGPPRGSYEAVLSYNAFFYLHPRHYRAFLSFWKNHLHPNGRIALLHNPCLHRIALHGGGRARRLLNTLDRATGVYHALQGGFWVSVEKLARAALLEGFKRVQVLGDPLLNYRCGVILSL